MSAHVIVVEDDPLMRSEIVTLLRGASFEVVAVGDAVTMDQELAQRIFHLALLDINLPGDDGLTIAQRLCGRADLGIVMLTARSGLQDRLEALERGADAYLKKPFHPQELIATLRSVLRRIQLAAMANEQTTWKFSPRNGQLVAPNGNSIELTVQETRIIDLLLRTPGAAVSRTLIARHLDDSHSGLYGGNDLEALIYRLRRKINAACPYWNPIRTAHRIGYRFMETPEDGGGETPG